MAFSKASACINLIAASYAWIAFANCLERARAEEVEGAEVDVGATEVLRDSTFGGRFAPRPVVDFPEERAPFLDDNFAAFAFKRMDLPLAVARFTAFLVAFAFAFAFVAMSRGEL
jgi:hypothetical protein